MTEQLPESYYHAILDAMPLMVFVVDDDVRIQDLNRAASAALTPEGGLLIQQRGGEALRCIHRTDDPGGCGKGPACKTCIIRNSVNQAFTGSKVHRTRTRAELESPTGPQPIDLLVTASPIVLNEKKRTLLVLEDITETTTLREIIPICANCKKIRDDANYWHQVEHYMAEHHGTDFTHGICPDCIEKLYPEVARNRAKRKSIAKRPDA